MNTNTKHFFLASYTGKGYVDFFKEEIESLDYVYVLKSVPGNGQTTLLQNIASHFQKKGETLDFIHQASDAHALEGLILKDQNVGIFEGTDPHILEPAVPYVDGEYVNLSSAVRIRDLESSKHQILRLKEQSDTNYQQFTQAVTETFSLHEDLEKFYSGELDIDAANQLASDTIQTTFGTSTLNKKAEVKDRFFEGSTESKHIDFVEKLTKDCTVRYFITGGPGTGKSVFMKKIAKASRERGYDVERYHCGFDPDSLDLIVLPELGVAAFDSTSPHDRDPSRAGDEIVDMSALLKQDPSEIYQKQIADIEASSKKAGSRADEYFEQARQADQEMADLYEQAVDFDKVKEMENDIIESISNNTGEKDRK